MNKRPRTKHFKKYFVIVEFNHDVYNGEFNDYFEVAALNRNHVKKLIKDYYGNDNIDIMDITIYKRIFANIFDVLLNRVPTEASCVHI